MRIITTSVVIPPSAGVIPEKSELFPPRVTNDPNEMSWSRQNEIDERYFIETDELKDEESHLPTQVNPEGLTTNDGDVDRLFRDNIPLSWENAGTEPGLQVSVSDKNVIRNEFSGYPNGITNTNTNTMRILE